MRKDSVSPHYLFQFEFERTQSMLLIRSTLFNIAFYINTIIRLVMMIRVILFGTSKQNLAQAKKWASTSNTMLDKIAGTKVEFEGLENLPEGGFIVAAQHQSFWDTFALMPYLDSPVFIYKEELNKIPLFGSCLQKTKMIAVDRSARGKAMAGVLKGARREVTDNGRQLFIFPEGTRRAVGAPLDYKFGVGRIYQDVNVPIVPVALVSGLFWPRHSFLRQPGKFKAKILPPIEPGLSIEDVMERLVSETQIASDELLLDAVENNPNLPITEEVKTRLELILSNKAADN